MSTFSTRYRSFIQQVQETNDHFGLDLETLAALEPILKFLHHQWWKIQITGLPHLPDNGPAMIVSNTSGVIPWPALMLIYTLMSSKTKCRRVSIVCDLDWLEDKQLYSILQKLGFVSWSSANVKKLFAGNELVAIFPEGSSAFCKSSAMRNRVSEFDWTRFLPAIEAGVKILPLTIFGGDEASSAFFNLESLSKALKHHVCPVSPLSPWIPFPINRALLPISWKMHLLPANDYQTPKDREQIENCAKKQALLTEGDIQAELNRLLRARHRIL